MNDTLKINHSEEEWKEILSPGKYQALRKNGTERPFTGKYYLYNEKGIYSCSGCGNNLFTSEMKFKSNYGWPSFDHVLKGERIKTRTDVSFGSIRNEIVCCKCDSHLGYVYDDGPTETGKRYTVNSVCLDFRKSGRRKIDFQKRKNEVNIH
jgi:peptide-methionine (R)-S-oxide reductase